MCSGLSAPEPMDWRRGRRRRRDVHGRRGSVRGARRAGGGRRRCREGRPGGRGDPAAATGGGGGNAMRRAGIDSTRVWISWAEVEANRGEYDWSNPDALIQAVSKEGPEVLPACSAPPPGRHRPMATSASAPAASRSRPPPRRRAPSSPTSRRRRSGATGPMEPSGRSNLQSRRGRCASGRSGTSRTWTRSSGRKPIPTPTPSCSLPPPRRSATRTRMPRSSSAECSGPEPWPTLIKATRHLRALYHDRRVAGSFDGVAIHPHSGSASGRSPRSVPCCARSVAVARVRSSG